MKKSLSAIIVISLSLIGATALAAKVDSNVKNNTIRSNDSIGGSNGTGGSGNGGGRNGTTKSQ